MRSALTVQKLYRSLRSLQAEFRELAVSNKALVLRHSILQSWSDGLACYQLSRALSDVLATDADQAEDSTSSSEELQQLLDQEDALLRQLSHSEISTADSNTDHLLDVGISTIAPPGYPIQFFKGLVQQAPAQNTAGITVQEFAEQSRQYVVQLSLHLHKLQSSGCAKEATAALKDLLDRYTHLHISLVMMGRLDVAAEVYTYNLDTLQSDLANLVAASQRTLELAPDLHLTQQQCDTISTGMDLYLALLGGIQEEQQGLKSQLEILAGPGPSSTAGDVSSSSGSNAGGANLHAQQLQQQQEMCRRLQALLQKEYVLQFVVCGWLMGSLSYEQLARAAVLAWPLNLRVTHLGIGIQRWHRRKQQQQQEQQEEEGSPA